MPFVLIVLTLISVPALAERSTPAVEMNCQEALEAYQRKLGAEVGDEFTTMRGQEPTVEWAGERPGRHGGRVITLRRIGATWGSRHVTVRFDLQGDPRWFIDILGADAAEFFGFKILDDHHVTIPDAAEFTGAVRAVDKLLTQPIPVSFYAAESNDNSSVTAYTEAFERHAGLPIAPSGNHLVHDISFHTGAIFLPPEMVEQQRKTLRAFSAFIDDQLRGHDPKSDEAYAIRHWARQVRRRRVIAIDNGTGLINPGIVTALRTKDLEILRQSSNHLRIPWDGIGGLIRSNLQNASFQPKDGRPSLVIGQSEIVTRWKHYAETRSSELRRTSDWEHEDDCKVILDRRAEIRAAALRLMVAEPRVPSAHP